MEIDIFPILHQKEGLARNFDRGGLEGTLCFLQVSSQGMEQHSRPRRDGGAHRSKPWSDTEEGAREERNCQQSKGSL